jgi:hypothetical protein
VWFLGASPALGQLIVNSQERRVEAYASILWDDFANLQFNIFEEDSDQAATLKGGPFVETVMAVVPNALFDPDSQATAWQDSLVSSNTIVAQGGVRDLLTPSRFQATSTASGRSTLEQEFSVVNATPIRLSGELVWAPTRSTCASAYFLRGGSVSYSLSGPVTLSRVPVDDGALCRVEPQHHSFTDILLLPPGTYTFSITAENQTGGSDPDVIVTPVSYDVHLEVLPIPEPATWSLLLLVLAPVILSRRFYGKFGRWHWLAIASRNVEQQQ